MKDSGKVDDSAHGDDPGPAVPEKPKSPEANAAAPRRADAIPIVSRHEAVSPPQIPPWPDEPVATERVDEVLVEPQGGAEPQGPVEPFIEEAATVEDAAPIEEAAPVEEAAQLALIEPASPPARAADDFDSHPTSAAEPPAGAEGIERVEWPAVPVDTASRVECHVPEPVATPPAAAAEPVHDDSSAAPDDSPAHPGDSEGLVPPVDKPAPDARSEPDEEDASTPGSISADADAGPVEPSADQPHSEVVSRDDASAGLEMHALPLAEGPAVASELPPDTLPPDDEPAPVREEQVSPVELPADDLYREVFSRDDASADFEIHASPLAEGPAVASDLSPDAAPPDDEPAASVREEQIWSGPEAVEPSFGALGRGYPDTSDPPAEIHGRTDPETSDAKTPDAQRAASSDVLVAAAREPALSPARLPLSAALPLPPAPYADRMRDAIPYARLAARAAGVGALMLAGAVLLLILLYRWVDPPTSTLMLGQRLTGTEIEQTWVPIGRISPHLIQAVILSEDGAFCRHHGVDWSALEEAMESSRGGSTITMQVVKNLFLWPQRSYVRKALEIVLAYVVEAVWPKERVIEIYLNIAEWGPGVFGAEAAANNQFGKAASRLTAQEAALLAVSLPSPLERQAAVPDWQMRRLANNLLVRMRAVRTAQRCVHRGGT